MQFKMLYLPLLALFFSFNLPPVTAAFFSPAHLGVLLPSSILVFFQQHISSQNGIFRTNEADLDPEHFWQRARELGDTARQYSEKLMKDAAATSQDILEKIGEVKDRMNTIVHGATALHDLQTSTTNKQSSDDEAASTFTGHVAEDLERALEKVLEELQMMCPAPEEAQGHEERQKKVAVALEKAGAALKVVCAKHGMDEDVVAAHWETIQESIEKLVVLVGDLVEQHPQLLSALLFTGAVMLIPEYWMLRPVMGVFGFGPIGPGKVDLFSATAASWAQRVFYGAAVPKGSWFSFLQKAAMSKRSWWDWFRGLFGW
ncbi:hypothetical protein B0H12DRAFT_1194812 [Mycena haematopus]|nr:hypothetical protein B0H12DRAFT_1194812 [Mycena haematopus]